ncbi:50S ribosomal protein L3 [Spiroplasma poulsonii]|nr:hypothetical protein [Spiroplasma poulsonii]PWF95726.1 50S ribosomal protein L3 [Spiroplasma poulsonii]
MGAEKVTIQNLEVVAIDTVKNALLVKGSIPGPNKQFVVIKETIKGLNPKTPTELIKRTVESKTPEPEIKTEKPVEVVAETPVEAAPATDAPASVEE